MPHAPPRPLPATIDLEASGLGRGSYPIEVGFVRADGLSWCSLVRPAEHWRHWDPQAEQVHGITREQLMRHGRPAREVAQALNAALAGQTVYSDAWGNDWPWLHQLHDEAGLPPAYRIEAVTALLDEPRRDALPPLRLQAFEALGIRRHRASSDALALQWALGRLLPS